MENTIDFETFCKINNLEIRRPINGYLCGFIINGKISEITANLILKCEKSRDPKNNLLGAVNFILEKAHIARENYGLKNESEKTTELTNFYQGQDRNINAIALDIYNSDLKLFR